jgi:hypothetical protein
MATPDLLDRQTAKQAGGAQLVEILNYDHRLIGAVVLCLARGISYVDKSLLFPVFSSSRRITSSTKAERSRLGKSSRSKLAVSVRIQNQTASFPDFGLPTLLRCSLGAILIVLGVQFRNCLLPVGGKQCGNYFIKDQYQEKIGPEHRRKKTSVAGIIGFGCGTR